MEYWCGNVSMVFFLVVLVLKSMVLDLSMITSLEMMTILTLDCSICSFFLFCQFLPKCMG